MGGLPQGVRRARSGTDPRMASGLHERECSGHGFRSSRRAVPTRKGTLMRIRRFVPVPLLLSLVVTARAGAATSVGVQVNIGAPPPPVVVYRSEPRLVLVPGSMVYMVDDDACAYDFFHV